MRDRDGPDWNRTEIQSQYAKWRGVEARTGGDEFSSNRCPPPRSPYWRSPTENVRSIRVVFPWRSLTDTTSVPRGAALIGSFSFSSQMSGESEIGRAHV